MELALDQSAPSTANFCSFFVLYVQFFAVFCVLRHPFLIDYSISCGLSVFSPVLMRKIFRFLSEPTLSPSLFLFAIIEPSKRKAVSKLNFNLSQGGNPNEKQ